MRGDLRRGTRQAGIAARQIGKARSKTGECHEIFAFPVQTHDVFDAHVQHFGNVGEILAIIANRYLDQRTGGRLALAAAERRDLRGQQLDGYFTGIERNQQCARGRNDFPDAIHWIALQGVEQRQSLTEIRQFDEDAIPPHGQDAHRRIARRSEVVGLHHYARAAPAKG